MTPHDANTRFARTWARLLQRYSLSSTRETLGPLETLFHRVKNPDAVLEDVARRVDVRDRLLKADGKPVPSDDAALLPYWAAVWESSMAIGGELLARYGLGGMSGMAVMDLGCGMGLAGCWAGLMGARVKFCDRAADALLFAYANARGFLDRASTRQLDWQKDVLPVKFDLILGADIVYERSQWPYLEPFWIKHVKPGGEVLLAEPCRKTGDLYLEILAQSSRLKATSSTRTVPATGRQIRLIRLTQLA